MSGINKMPGFLRKKSFIVIAVVVLFGFIGIGLTRLTLSRNKVGRVGDHPTFIVRRGPLRISVVESGTIKAREQVIIKNEVEGKTSILYLIPEGIRVKKGELLVELDASNLMDEKIDQQIRVQNAEAAYVGARENLAVVENQAQSDVDKAELAYGFAQEDLKKYLEGDYPNELKEARSRITLAKEELTRATEKWEWSKKLSDEKYISQTELNADELTVKQKELDLELSQNNLGLLKNFTHKRMLAQLKSDVKQARMAFERTGRKAKADVVQAKANLEAKKAEFERQKDKLKKIEEQTEKTKIYALAPADWEYVMYLDADTEIIADISFLYDVLADGWEMVICKNPGRFHVCANMVRPDNPDECAKTFAVMGTKEATQLNGGVFAFRRCERVKAFFDAWHDEWQRWGKREWR